VPLHFFEFRGLVPSHSLRIALSSFSIGEPTRDVQHGSPDLRRSIGAIQPFSPQCLGLVFHWRANSRCPARITRLEAQHRCNPAILSAMPWARSTVASPLRVPVWMEAFVTKVEVCSHQCQSSFQGCLVASRLICYCPNRIDAMSFPCFRFPRP
jgi:hypothetical protein